MRLLIKNEYGSFEMGGGGHPSARILQISGLGLPEKEPETITFSGQAGRTTKSIRDLSRVITFSFDFYGGQYETEKLYRMLYHPCELYFTFGTRRRKITGTCINSEDIEKIIYHRHYKMALQFECDNPYFNDFNNTEIAIFQRIDQFPNLSENGTTYIQLPAIATKRITQAEINNKGEIEVYPIIRIYNNQSNTIPVTSEDCGIEIVNKTTDSVIRLNYELQPSDEITVDLPHRKIISSVSGNITNKISDDTVLSEFVLKCGKNLINCNNLNSNQEIHAVVEFTNNYAMAVM